MQKFHRKTRRRGGFTLLEVLLVLAILGVIAAIAVPQLLGRQQEAMIKATASSVKGLEDAVKLYAVEHDGRFPATLDLLLSGVDEETGQERAPYLEDIPADAWGNVLNYEYPPTGERQTMGGKPAIWSYGPDMQDGTEDDINNWTSKFSQ